jgi:uncharacterized Zn-finger protein
MPAQSSNMKNEAKPARTVEVTASELPLHCPTAEQTVWDAHPRVFLPIEESGEALCPYCGTLYKLKGGAGQSGH